MIQIHTLLVLCHVLALALGLGAALLADWIVVRKLAFGIVSQRAASQLADLSRAVGAGLALIWLTGALLVLYNAWDAPASIMNQKLWAKLVIVAALTCNALLLHRVVLPMVKDRIGYTLFTTILNQIPVISILLGVVSAISWIFAAYLGVARELNGQANLVTILSAYAMAVVWFWLGAVLMCLSVHHYKTQPGTRKEMAM